MSESLILSQENFELFQKFLVAETGLFFNDDRDSSLRNALWERLKKKGHSSYEEYYHFLRYHPEGRLELQELAIMITTGETSFFRNKAQFDVLMRDVLPDIIQKKMSSSDKFIRIWSAGSSKGDEAYSIAIAIMEVLPDYANWNISILATDINGQVLADGREGVYYQKDLGELPDEYIGKYFQRRGSNYILSADVKKLVRFEYHNLARDSFYLDGMRDVNVIFCRNVTIYFDAETTKRLFDNFYDCLATDGYVFSWPFRIIMADQQQIPDH